MKRATAIACAAVILSAALLLSPAALADQTREAEWEEETVEEVLLPDAGGEEDWAEGYIGKKLYPARKAGVLKAPRLVGSRLEGIDRQIYQGLYDGAADVAAGLRESTVFVFNFEALYDQRVFTAGELGVEKILEDGKLTQEAKDQAKRMLAAPDFPLIDRALLADCPYELYWFNKAEGGMRITTARTYRATSSAVTVNGTFTVSMTVSGDYAAGDYLVDTSYGQGVSAAAETAREIAARYDACADLEKLTAYKNEICERTAYCAEAENGSMPYGNPWQLVWVFDGDPETSVTCEGYAKAFQYLCDLSSGGVSVISVSGKMNGANHMWNIAAMEDGRNYLIDVTNCDSGMAGYPDGLFLAGAEEGNAAVGYTFSAGSGNLTYLYSPDVPFSADELKIAYWPYGAGGPPAPAFRAVSEELFENDKVLFCREYAGYAYDEITAEISYLDPMSGENQVSELTVSMPQEEPVWAYEPVSLPSGSYSFRFFGSRDGADSAWTEPIAVSVADLGELIPTYRFSTAVGYAGYCAVVRLDQRAQGIRILETEKEYPCEGRDVLIPLEEMGDHAYTVALIWNGKYSAYGETASVTVREAPEGPVLTIPDGVQIIKNQAFRGVGVSRLLIPDSVESIGEYAFADNERLLWVEIGAPEAAETAFENCPEAVFHPAQMDWGFDRGLPFVW